MAHDAQIDDLLAQAADRLKAEEFAKLPAQNRLEAHHAANQPPTRFKTEQ